MTAQSEQSFSRATDLFGRSVDSTNFILDNWALWVLVIVVTLLVLKVRSEHALLSQLDERCEAAFADIDAILAERHALIPNLIETVKAFAAQEHKVLKDVIDARARATSATGGARLDAEAQVGASLANLWDITENYPELGSSGHFRELRSEMTRIEEKIAASRKFYNLAVEEMNGERRAFPGNVIDALSHLGRHDKFSLGERRAELAEPVRASF
jgi:LemA protein